MALSITLCDLRDVNPIRVVLDWVGRVGKDYEQLNYVMDEQAVEPVSLLEESELKVVITLSLLIVDHEKNAKIIRIRR